jgi:short-subunit dehydrogenase
LTAVAEECRAKGAEVLAQVVDACDAPGMAAFVEEADRRRPLDLVVANAGVSAGTGEGDEPPDQIRRITRINVEGVLNTVEPALAAMAPRRRGQIGLISSLASFRGFPGAPAYCASKAWVRIWGEGMRGHLRARGIGVTVLCPGFVKTAVAARNAFRMPLLWTAERAAARIARGLAKNRARVAFPFPLYWLIWGLGSLPPWSTDWLFRRLPKKGAGA